METHSNAPPANNSFLTLANTTSTNSYEKLKYLKKKDLSSFIHKWQKLMAFILMQLNLPGKVIKIVFFISVIQFYIPSLVIKDTFYLDESSVINNTNIVLSTFSRFIWITVEIDRLLPLVYIFILINLIQIVSFHLLSILFGRSYILKKSFFDFITYYYTIYFFNVIPIQVGIYVELLCQSFDNNSKSLMIISFIAVCVFIISLPTLYIVLGPTIYFEPYPHLSIRYLYRAFYMLCMLLLVTVSNFIPFSNNIHIKSCLLSIEFVTYLSCFLFHHFYGFYIRYYEDLIMTGAEITGMISCITGVVFLECSVRPQSYIYFMFFLIFLISCFLYRYIHTRLTIKRLIKLQNYNEAGVYFNIKNINEYFLLIITGFRESYSCAANLNFVEDFLLEYKSNLNFLILYAKLISPYSNSIERMQYILSVLKSLPKSFCKSKIFIIQVELFILSKDLTYNQFLRKKLSHLGDLTEAAKEFVCGALVSTNMVSTREMIKIFEVAADKIGDIDTQYINILHFYGNNIFLLKNYVLFLKKVSKDTEKYNEVQFSHQLLLHKKSYLDEVPFSNARNAFPDFPASLTSSKLDGVIKEETIAGTPEGNYFYAIPEEDSDQLTVKLSGIIESLSIPSVKYSIHVYIVGAVIMLAISLVLFFAINRVIHVNVAVNFYFETALCVLESVTNEIFLYTNLNREISIGIFPELYYSLNLSDRINERFNASLGYTDVIQSLKFYIEENSILKGLLDELFINNISVKVYNEDGSYFYNSQTVYHTILNTIMSSYEIFNKYFDYNWTRKYKSVKSQLLSSNQYSKSITYSFSEYNSQNLHKHKSRIMYVCLVISLVIFLLFFATCFVTNYFIRKDRKAVLSCFHSIPRSSIDNIIANLSDDVQQYIKDQEDEKNMRKISRIEIGLSKMFSLNYQVFLCLFFLCILVSLFVIFMYSRTCFEWFSNKHPIIYSASSLHFHLSSLASEYLIINSYFNGEDVSYEEFQKSLDYINTSIDIGFKAYDELFIQDTPVESIVNIFPSISNHIFERTCYEDESYSSMFRCSSLLNKYYLVMNIFRETYYSKFANEINDNSYRFVSAMNVIVDSLLEEFTYNVLNFLYTTEREQDSYDISFLFFAILLVTYILGIFFMFLTIIFLNKEKENIKIQLRWLLHVDPDIVFKSRVIMSILDTEFKEVTISHKIESNVSENIIENLPFPIVILDSKTKIIVSQNKKYLSELSIHINHDILLSISNSVKGQIFSINSREYEVHLITGKNVLYIFFYDVTDKNNMIREIQLEKEYTEKLLTQDIPHSITSVSSDSTSILAITFPELSESFNKLVQYITTKKNTKKYIDYLEVKLNTILVYSGLFTEGKTSDTVSELIQLALKIVTKYKKRVQLALECNASVVGQLIDYNFYLCSENIDICRILSFEAPPGGVILRYQTYEYIYKLDFKIKEYATRHVYGLGSVNLFVLSK